MVALIHEVPTTSARMVEVTVTFTHNPGYIWYKQHDGKWASDSALNGRIVVDDDGGVPARTYVRDKITT